MSSSNSPCAACKLLRRKCTQECVFAPYFPPDLPHKFANVHRVFGASNVTKILNELPANQREDAVNSLAYEAEARLRDPVYGCVGLISVLQSRLKQVQTDLHMAKQELYTYIGPSAMVPCLNPGVLQQYQNMQPAMHSNSNMQQMLTLQGPGNLRDAQHQQQLYEAHQRQFIDAGREQQMLRHLEHQQRLQQHQQQLQQQQQQQSADFFMRFNSGFDDGAGPSGTSGESSQVNPSGFTQLTSPAAISPSLALGSSYDNNNMFQIQQQHHRLPENEQHHHQPPHEQHHQVQQHHHQPPHEQQQQHHHHQQSSPEEQLQQLQLLPPHLMLQHQPQPPPQQPPLQLHHGDGSEEGRSVGPAC